MSIGDVGLAGLVTAVGDLVWPARCAGCGLLGTGWCTACAAGLAAGAFPGGPRVVQPSPAPVGLPPTVAWGPYADPVRALMVAYKDEQRRDLAAVLSPLLAQVLLAGPARVGGVGGVGEGPAYVVPVPSSAAAVRRRGDRPLEALGRAATRAVAGYGGLPAVRWAPALRTTRDVSDQSRLGHAQRAANLAGAFTVSRRWRAVLAGAPVIVVDDVMTTGATLADASRALREAGARVPWCAAVAATARRAAVVPCARSQPRE